MKLFRWAIMEHSCIAVPVTTTVYHYHLFGTVCQCWYHAVFAGISNDVFSVLKLILPAVGCEECVGVISTKRKSLQAELDHVSTTVQKLQQNYSDQQVIAGCHHQLLSPL